MVDETLMSPEASPGGEKLRSGVRRVNNWPLYIGGIAVAGFMLMIALVMIDRANRQQEQEAEVAKKGGNSSMYAKTLTDKYEGFIMPKAPPVTEVPKAEPAKPELTVPIATTDLDTPPAPPREGGRTQRDQDLEQFRQMKQQMFIEAMKAPTAVQVADARMPSARGDSAPAALAASNGDRRAAMVQRLADVRRQLNELKADGSVGAYKKQLDMMRVEGLLPDGGMGGYGSDYSAPQLIQTPAAPPKPKTDFDQFAGDETTDRWKLNSQAEPPRTPFELRAGFVIPATMITGVNSDLPGQIMAQTSSDVYDTPTGRHLLIPQGSRLVGTYDAQVAYGQERVLIAWQRIVFPDGRAMDIGAMPGADAGGYAGFEDQVNHHYVRVFGSAVLMSLVTAGISYSQNRGNTLSLGYQQTASGALSQALGQQLGMATAQMLMKNLSISPTIEIQPGYRFNVMVSKDMTFSKPYRSFNY